MGQTRYTTTLRDTHIENLRQVRADATFLGQCGEVTAGAMRIMDAYHKVRSLSPEQGGCEQLTALHEAAVKDFERRFNVRIDGG